MKTKKKTNQVKRYYSVTFNDDNETIINPKGCITNATPIILNEYDGKKGQEVIVAQYDLTKAKINSDTPVTQEKALTKAELLQLYEEFKEKKREEFRERLNRYDRESLDRLKYKLGGFKYAYRDIISYKIKRKWVSVKELNQLMEEVEDERPTYTEPTFNEFMESLENKGESHGAGRVIDVIQGIYNSSFNNYLNSIRNSEDYKP